MDLKQTVSKRVGDLSTDCLRAVRCQVKLWTAGWLPRYDSELRTLVEDCGLPFTGVWIAALGQEVTEELLHRAEAVLEEAGQFLKAGGPCAVRDALAVMGLYPVED